MDVASFGDHKVFNWTREHLLQVLTTGKKPVLTDDNLIKAFVQVDRADFIPAELKTKAYEDIKLQFAGGQELDSPIIIAEMLSGLELKPGYRVLDLGTGSGYVTALIASTIGESGKVFTVERNQEIYEIARLNLQKYPQLHNYEQVFMDGSTGLVARAPFDAIHISFAYEKIPHELLVQLNIGAKLVTPLTNMHVKLYTRIDQHNIKEDLLSVKSFTKLIPGVE